MTPDRDPIVGHKTLSDGQGGVRHEPLRQTEADALWAASEAAREQRALSMPTEQDALHQLFAAYQRLKELGWTDAQYCPKDGSLFDVIEVGSTGVHRCSYEGQWPTGRFWIHGDGDLWPSRPILFRRTP